MFSSFSGVLLGSFWCFSGGSRGVVPPQNSTGSTCSAGLLVDGDLWHSDRLPAGLEAVGWWVGVFKVLSFSFVFIWVIFF